jgi:hypothetical protein
MISDVKIQRQSSKIERINIPSGSSGLTRSHRLIRIEKEKEQLFIKICTQIRLNDYKKNRSNNQRDLRRLKRQIKSRTTQTA